MVHDIQMRFFNSNLLWFYVLQRAKWLIIFVTSHILTEQISQLKFNGNQPHGDFLNTEFGNFYKLLCGRRRELYLLLHWTWQLINCNWSTRNVGNFCLWGRALTQFGKPMVHHYSKVMMMNSHDHFAVCGYRRLITEATTRTEPFKERSHHCVICWCWSWYYLVQRPLFTQVFCVARLAISDHLEIDVGKFDKCLLRKFGGDLPRRLLHLLCWLWELANKKTFKAPPFDCYRRLIISYLLFRGSSFTNALWFAKLLVNRNR